MLLIFLSLLSTDIYSDMIRPGLDSSTLWVQTWRPGLLNITNVSNLYCSIEKALYLTFAKTVHVDVDVRGS